MNKLRFLLFSLTFILIFSGCATIIGPDVDKEEIKRATEELRVKALSYQIQQLGRLHKIANNLMFSIPKEDIKGDPQPFLGVVGVKIDKYLEKLYNLDRDQGVVVIILREDSPALRAGIMAGDIIVAIDGRKIKNTKQFSNIVSKFDIGQLVTIKISRDGYTFPIDLRISQIPVNAPLVMIDEQGVNAATDGKSLYVTYGLMNFAKSDDEIASVLAHEMAHLVRGHVSKAQGGRILGAIVAIALGTVAEVSSPGSGEVVMRTVGGVGDAFNARFSRDLEREADYFGTRFVYYSGYDPDVFATFFERFAIEIPASMTRSYFSTHPSSPERMLRVRKIVEELKSQGR